MITLEHLVTILLGISPFLIVCYMLITTPKSHALLDFEKATAPVSYKDDLSAEKMASLHSAKNLPDMALSAGHYAAKDFSNSVLTC